MTAQLSKIAILRNEEVNYTFELDEIQRAMHRTGVEVKIFEDNASILEYKPDCVFITSPQDPKLTPFPTYGLINQPRDEYLEIPRFLRNVLTYDAYLTVSPRLTEMLRDVMFGARKLGSGILHGDFYPAATEFTAPVLSSSFVIFEPDFEKSHFKNAISTILKRMKNAFVLTCTTPKSNAHSDRFIVATTPDEIEKVIKQHGIAVCLNSGDEQEKLINANVMKLIASSAVTITHQTELLKSHFGDSLFYIAQAIDVGLLVPVIQSHLKKIMDNSSAAIEKSQKAHQIFLDKFSFDHIFKDFQAFHQKTLFAKGYAPHPDPEVEKKLPSVTYIMRTGGKHRPFLERALDCLVSQQYPDLRVLFVTHVHVSFLPEIIEKYPTIKFKILESIKSRRSEAIRDGMAAVETDLFGLFDDDDELYPNHVRMLVKAMQYNSNRDWRGEIGMAYSGSIHADDTYPVYERVEFQDHKLKTARAEKRAIEHFKFYSSMLMSQHSWFMPNGWLARTKLIDEELLEDPALDTCEDLYFELQIAQKAHFAFSLEVTAVHHFHHLGNSTIDDSHKHLPDTQRIGLRNFARMFPPSSLYDTPYTIIGKHSCHNPNQIVYQDLIVKDRHPEYFHNQFYPFRPAPEATGLTRALQFNGYKRTYYLAKFKQTIKEHGYLYAIKKTVHFLQNRGNKHFMNKANNAGFLNTIKQKRIRVIEFYFKSRMVIKYLGWSRFFSLAVGKIVGKKTN